MNLLEFFACSAGLCSGYVAGWLTATASSRPAVNSFWQQFSVVAGLLLNPSEQRSFLREYLQLWSSLAKYLLQKIGTLPLVLSPIAVAFLILRVVTSRGAGASRLGEMISVELTSLADWELMFLLTASLATLLVQVKASVLGSFMPFRTRGAGEPCVSGEFPLLQRRGRELSIPMR